MNVKFYQDLIDDELSMNIILDMKGLVEIGTKKSNLEREVLKDISSKKTFQNKNEAYQFLKELYENGLSHLEDKLLKFNPRLVIEEAMIFFTPLNILSILKLNGKLDLEKIKVYFPKIYKSLNSIKNNNEEDIRILFTTLSSYIGTNKKAIDVLVNVNLVRIEENQTASSLNRPSDKEFLEILDFSFGVCRLFNFFQMVSKEKESDFSDNTIYVENGELYYHNSKDFMVNLATNAAFKDFTYPVKDSELNKIYGLYEEEFGFSPEKVLKTFNRMFKQDSLEMVFCSRKDEFRKLINISKGTLTLKGLLTLLETDICLEYNKQDRYKFIFSDKCKVSTKGLVKIQDNYFFNFATIASYSNKLGNNLLNQNFLRNNELSSEKISRYLANSYAEKWLVNLHSKLTSENIWIQIQVKNFEQKFNFPDSRRTTKEVDFILFDASRKVLLIGEYKNWQDVSFNFLDIHKEQEKIKKINKSHINLLNILELEKKVLFELLNLEIDYAKLELINVFENRNMLCNNRELDLEKFNIKNFTRVEFEKYIEDNKPHFYKLKENNRS